MEKAEHPLVSCLCITRAKPKLLQRSISCFLGQTYPNKELVVVYDADDSITKKAINSIKHLNVFFYSLKKSKGVTLGYMRNKALEKAKGDYTCLWADDDWHHMARIEYQYETIGITGSPACVLNYTLIFDETNQKTYVSRKRHWEETLFCEKGILKNIGDHDCILEEDTALVENLIGEGKLYLINDVPNLYLYTYYHGKDTWSDRHWSKISDYSYELNSTDSQIIKNILERNESVAENSLSIDQLLGNPLFEENEDQGPDKIPKIIHLTYKSKTIPDKYKTTFDSIKALHPDWEIRIYDDSDAEKVVEDHFSEILDIYKAYPCNVQRTDIFRILIVYLKGGFYLDLDIYCLKSLDELRHLNLVLGEEITHTAAERKLLNFKNEIQVANYMFGSVPEHSFWIEVLLETIKRADKKIVTLVDVLKTTGPWMLSYVYYNMKDKYKDIKLLRNKFKRCHNGCPTVSCHFGDFASHRHLGSWLWHKKNDLPQPNNELNNLSERAIRQALERMSKRLEH